VFFFHQVFRIKPIICTVSQGNNSRTIHPIFWTVLAIITTADPLRFILKASLGHTKIYSYVRAIRIAILTISLPIVHILTPFLSLLPRHHIVDLWPSLWLRKPFLPLPLTPFEFLTIFAAATIYYMSFCPSQIGLSFRCHRALYPALKSLPQVFTVCVSYLSLFFRNTLLN